MSTRAAMAGWRDGAIVARVLDGERDAFAELVRRHQDELYRHARSLRIDHDAASDIVQEAFVTAYTRLAQCADPERFRFWIFRILRNRCIDYLRDIRRRTVALDDVKVVAHGTPGDAVRAVELREVIERALGELPTDLSEAFLMKHHEGRSYHEMAEIADASVPAMKMRVHRAREALRDTLLAAGIGLSV